MKDFIEAVKQIFAPYEKDGIKIHIRYARFFLILISMASVEFGLKISIPLEKKVGF